MKISVNAPSYRRADDVKTLAYLPYCRIWVDEGEAEEYRRHYPDADIIACPSGVQGNLCRVRNYILECLSVWKYSVTQSQTFSLL